MIHFTFTRFRLWFTLRLRLVNCSRLRYGYTTRLFTFRGYVCHAHVGYVYDYGLLLRLPLPRLPPVDCVPVPRYAVTGCRTLPFTVHGSRSSPVYGCWFPVTLLRCYTLLRLRYRSGYVPTLLILRYHGSLRWFCMRWITFVATVCGCLRLDCTHFTHFTAVRIYVCYVTHVGCCCHAGYYRTFGSRILRLPFMRLRLRTRVWLRLPLPVYGYTHWFGYIRTLPAVLRRTTVADATRGYRFTPVTVLCLRLPAAVVWLRLPRHTALRPACTRFLLRVRCRTPRLPTLRLRLRFYRLPFLVPVLPAAALRFVLTLYA